MRPILGCRGCGSSEWNIVDRRSSDGKWVQYTRLCPACKEAVSLTLAKCGPVNVDADGREVPNG